MLKINDIEITREDFKELLHSIKIMRRVLKSGDIEVADFMLEKFEKSLEKNLEADAESIENQNEDLKIYDKVKIISAPDLETRHYVGQEGWIVNIDLSYDYPYEVEFDNPIEFKNDWLWEARNLQKI